MDTASGYGKGYDYPPSLLERWTRRLETPAREALKSLIWLILGTIGFFTAPHHRQPPLTSATFHPKRILIVRTDLLGDVVMTLPVVASLQAAYPDALIDILVQPSVAPILHDQPYIHRVLTTKPDDWIACITTPRLRADIRATINTLRAAQYDLAISVCGDIGSIITRLSGARRRVGYVAEAYPWFMTDPVPSGRFRLHQHEIAYGLALAAHAGGSIFEGDALRRPHLVISTTTAQQVSDILADRGFSPSTTYIALHAGSGNGKAKRWPLPLWARLADELAEQYPDVSLLLIGAPSDRHLASAILQRMHHHDRIIDLTGATSLPQLSALLGRCAVLITGDSGPMHIAEAVGIRVVALHGPTDPVNSGPCQPTSIILRRDIWCSPCYDWRATAECRFGNPVCMKGITVAEVREAVARQIFS